MSIVGRLAFRRLAFGVWRLAFGNLHRGAGLSFDILKLRKLGNLAVSYAKSELGVGSGLGRGRIQPVQTSYCDALTTPIRRRLASVFRRPPSRWGWAICRCEYRSSWDRACLR